MKATTRLDTDKCAKCKATRLVHRTTANKNCPVFVEAPVIAPATIRYEIEANLPGLIINAPGIVGVCATRGRVAKSIVIVYVAIELREDFEKEIEGNLHVIGYHADPGGTATKETAYVRKAARA